MTDVILATSCNSASREYTLAGRNVYQELICLLNHDTKGWDTTKRRILFFGFFCANYLLLILQGKSPTVVSVSLHLKFAKLNTLGL